MLGADAPILTLIQFEPVSEAAYDRMGVGYREIRRPDPRIAVRIGRALGDARTVLNVGAGTGSYEPSDREVTAVEPSELMISQRPAGLAPVVRATAEDLPFGDGSFDAAMAIITVHHWADPAAGLAEMARVARRRVVVLSFDPAPLSELWLVREYFPGALEIHANAMPPIERLAAMLPNASVEEVPVPRLCEDGFFCALWDRPEMHLDPMVRRASSVWHLMPAEETERGLAALRADLESGRWDESYGHLRTAPELDVGVRLVVFELG
jgi:SAM-dependent methyltransferase